MSNEQNILEKKCILKQNEPKNHITIVFSIQFTGIETERPPYPAKISSSSFRNEGVRENGVFLNF